MLIQLQETRVLFRMIQLHIKPVIIDDAARFVQVRADRNLRYDILVTVETEHLHALARQAVPDVIRCRVGIAEDGIPFRQIRAHDPDKGRAGCSIAVSGDEQDRAVPRTDNHTASPACGFFLTS